MTQQPQGDAVGGASDTVVAAEPTLEDRFAAISGDEEKKPEEEVSDEAIAAEAEAQLSEGETVEETGEPEGAEPSIDPPVSWNAEEKEEFKTLPPAAQKVIARREAEREKFVQSKAQEAKQARSQVEQEAMQVIQRQSAQYAQQLQQLLPAIPEKPSYQLQIDDPIAFADQMEAHEYAVAQYNYVQHQIQQATVQAQQAEAEAQRLANEQIGSVLAEQFPEYLDPNEGPKLREQLGSIALELGYSAQQLANVDANDILAMRKVATYKSKADKYDALMAKQMEKVREAKNLPKVSRPGAARPAGTAANERYTADRQAMKRGDRDATVRVFDRFV